MKTEKTAQPTDLNQKVKRFPVIEIFGPTIQGEGALIGAQTVFIRFGGCDYRCSWCFGVVPGRRIPRVILSREANKKINEVQVGDKLMTFDEDQNLVETEVTNVLTREVDRWLRVTIEGTQYFVTEEHPFFTTRGMIPAHELQVGDMILHATPEQKMSFRMVVDNPHTHKNPDVIAKSAANTDYANVGRRISQTVAKQKEEGAYVKPWDRLTEEQRQRVREKISAANSGPNNGNWKGGKNRNQQLLKKMVREGEITKCSWCGAPAKEFKPHNGVGLDVHHKDGNHENDAMENLVVVCESCHYSDHEMGYNFWKSERRDGKEMTVAQNGMRVEKIKLIDRADYPPSTRPKPLKVYNLSCAPYNTYLVDYMWVHNCDTPYAVDPQQVRENATYMTAPEIIAKVRELGPHTPWVTLSGGNPALHDLDALVLGLKDHGYDISVETQGTVFKEWLNLCDLVVVSPKPPSSGMVTDWEKLDAFFDGWASFNRAIKIVIFDEKDLAYAESVTQRYSPSWTPFLQVGNRVGQDNVIDLLSRLEWLATEVLKRPALREAFVLPQLHVLMWGNKRGV